MKKNFFKSKKGNYAIFAIVLIPVILSLVATLVCNQRNKTVYKSEIKTSISSFFEYENKYHSTIIVKKNDDGIEQDYCIYSPTDREIIKADFADFFQKIDGYNSLWSYNTIEYKENNGSYSIAFKCTVYIPKLTTLKVIDYWGIDAGPYKTSDGYYQTHANTMKTLYSHAKNESGAIEGTDLAGQAVNISEKYWQKIEIEVNSSCV